KVVVVFWTRNSAASGNVQHEAAIAREDDKLIPAQLELMKAVDFPMGFYTTQAPQLHDWDGRVTHSGYSSLIKAIRSRFEGSRQQIAEIARREIETELESLQRRAKSGEPDAQAELGYRHERGIGLEKNDKEAVQLWKLAAEQGSARAQSNLGFMYLN